MEEQIRALWKAAHQKVLLDERWLQNLLVSALPVQHLSQTEPLLTPTGSEASAFRRIDLVEALDVSHFVGCEVEVAELTRWIVQERCRLIVLLGMGGIGKSMLASYLGRHLTHEFEAVLWRSVRDAPSCEELVADCITFFSETPPAAFPASLEQRITQLLSRLQARRCLLVLDNLETLLKSGDREGNYLAGYAGNPLALKIVAQAISDLFGGDLDRFLREGELIFNGVRPVLRQQVGRLSPLEHLLLAWLAVLREWTKLDTLVQVLHPRVLRAQLLEALEALSRRSLLERGQQASFGLQSVVMEY